MPDHMRADVSSEASEFALPDQVEDVWLPLIQQRIIRTFPVEQNAAMPGDGSPFFAILGQIRRISDRLGRMNYRFVPIGIDHSLAAIPKMNWNLQPFRNEARVISLTLIQPID